MNEELDAFIAELEAAGASDEEITAILDERLKDKDAGVTDYLGAGVGAINRGISQVVSQPLKFIGAGGNYLQSLVTGEDVDPKSGLFTQAGEAVQDFTEDINPRYDNVNQTYQSVGEGLGQAAGMIATAGLGTASKGLQAAELSTGLLPATGRAAAQLGKQILSPSGVIGGSMTAVPEWEAAKEAGLSDEEAFEVLIKNYAVGQTEQIPIQNLLSRINRITGNGLVNTVKNMGIQGLEEGTQEAIQQYLTNEVAKDNYDPDRDPLFQVLESAKVGGIVGLILPGVASIAQLQSPEKKVKLERKVAEIQADAAIDESSTGDPQLDAEIDAAASLNPSDKQIIEEAKIADVVQEEQVEKEREEKLQEDFANQESGNKTPDAENKDSKSGEKAENGQDTAELKPSQTPEYKIALDKVQKLQDQFTKLDINENADQLLFDLREARQALQRIAGTPKKAKTEIQKQIEDTTGVTKPEKSVKLTPNEAIKQQVQTFYKGVQEGVYRGKDATNELVNKVQDAIKDSPLNPKQISSILTRVKRTNLFTPGSISRLNTFVDRVSSDAEYSDKLSEAQSINKKLRKLSKSSSSNLQNVKGIARSFASINPEDTFINKHLGLGRQILSSLTSPTNANYSPVNVAEAEEYITDLQSQIIEQEEKTVEPQGDKRNVQVFQTLQSSIDALNQKDLSEFDDSEKRIIETIKSVDPSSLTNDQATSIVRVIDNIVENDDLSNAAAVEPIIKSKEVLKNLTEKYKDVKTKLIRDVGKVGASTYQQFARIFGDSGIAADVQQQTGILDIFNAGSRVENQEIKLTKDLKNKIQEINKKYKIKVQELPNQVKLTIFSELYKNYGDDSHIAKVKSNIERTIKEYEKTDPDEAKVWAEQYTPFRNVKTVEDARNAIDPALFEVWEFFNKKFGDEINSKLGKVTNELYNKPYVEADNYSHTSIRKLTDTTSDKETFGDTQNSKQGKIKPIQSKTSLTATRNLPQGYGYTSDFIESQLKGYRESLYDIEASRANALVRETIYSPEFEELVGGIDNAKIVRGMIKRAEEIQRGMSRATANEAVKWLNSTTQFIRNIGSARALGSVVQPVKQVPSVWVKAFFNHAGSGSLDTFFKGIGAINLIESNPNVKKLLDQYTVGVRGERLGGIERGDAVGYRLSPGATQKGARAAEWLQRQSEKFSRVILKPLTNSDVYAARTTWIGYYLQSLKEQDVTSVDLNSEYLKQEDPKRKTAAAFAEQMVAETQVGSNPATLAQLSRNENDGGWNFAKNLLLPFSTFSLNAKYRTISDISKFIRNPNSKNAGAVAGDTAEILAFAAIAQGLLPYYKDWLKQGIEALFGLESEEPDEEKATEKKKRAFWTNVTNAVVPFSIGTVGEYGVSKLANNLAYIAENPDASYEEWKKETGGFVYEPENAFDAGVYGLGFQPYVETVNGAVDLTKSINGDAITYDNFGRTEEATLTEEQTNLLAIKTLLEAAGTIGIGESDLYNQVKKIFKEQLRQKEAPVNRRSPRPRPRPQLIK